MLDKAEQDAIRQILRKDEKAGFLDRFERDLLQQILNRHSGPRAGSATTPGSGGSPSTRG